MTVKSGRQYADDVRELRAQGVDFPAASQGYILADAANWSSGQKAAVTRAINLFDFTAFDKQQEALQKARDRKEPPAKRRRQEPPPGELSERDKQAFFDDALGEPEDDDEFDDIAYFDFDEGEEFIDEESDQYEENT